MAIQVDGNAGKDIGKVLKKKLSESLLLLNDGIPVTTPTIETEAASKS